MRIDYALGMTVGVGPQDSHPRLIPMRHFAAGSFCEVHLGSEHLAGGYGEGSHFVVQTKFGCHNTFGKHDPPSHHLVDDYIWEVGWLSPHLLDSMT